MQTSELDKRILVSAYQCDLERKGINFNEWATEQGLSHDEVWHAFEELADQGFVQHRALGGHAEITGRGVLLCEELGLADMARVAQDTSMRTQILDKVAKAHEQYGRHSVIPYDIAKPEPPFDEKQWDFNFAVLMDAGLLTRGRVMGSIDITDYGKQVVQEWRERSSMAAVLEGAQTCLPEERAAQLSAFMEQLLSLQQWTVVSKHKSGILAQRYGQYYRVHCLWENEPVGVDAVNTFFKIVCQQPAVRGALTSWSGFTEEASKYAVTNSIERPLILLQQSDIAEVLQSKIDLDSLTQSKLDAIVHYHESHPQEVTRVAAMNPSDPEELQPFLRKFRQDNPDPSKCVFIMMRFGSTSAHDKITHVIKEALKQHGLRIYLKSRQVVPIIVTSLCGVADNVQVRCIADNLAGSRRAVGNPQQSACRLRCAVQDGTPPHGSASRLRRHLVPAANRVSVERSAA